LILLLVFFLSSVVARLEHSATLTRGGTVRTDVDVQNLSARQIAAIAHARDFSVSQKRELQRMSDSLN